LALEALFWAVTGSIVGTLFEVAIPRSAASKTPRVELPWSTTCEVSRGPSRISTGEGTYPASGTPSKKSTHPVSREYSVPIRSLCSTPFARTFARPHTKSDTVPKFSRELIQKGRVLAESCLSSVASNPSTDRRMRSTIDRRFRDCFSLGLMSSSNVASSASRMTLNHNERCAEPFCGKFHAADLRGRDDVSGNTDDEEITQALVENDLC
jgi:hypothetical protein